MSVALESIEYRSPRGKLIRFFRRSRDGWKERCLLAKANVKRLTNGTVALQKSRDQWKSQAKQLRQEVRELTLAVEAQKMRSP